MSETLDRFRMLVSDMLEAAAAGGEEEGGRSNKQLAAMFAKMKQAGGGGLMKSPAVKQQLAMKGKQAAFGAAMVGGGMKAHGMKAPSSFGPAGSAGFKGKSGSSSGTGGKQASSLKKAAPAGSPVSRATPAQVSQALAKIKGQKAGSPPKGFMSGFTKPSAATLKTQGSKFGQGGGRSSTQKSGLKGISKRVNLVRASDPWSPGDR